MCHLRPVHFSCGPERRFDFRADPSSSSFVSALVLAPLLSARSFLGLWEPGACGPGLFSDGGCGMRDAGSESRSSGLAHRLLRAMLGSRGFLARFCDYALCHLGTTRASRRTRAGGPGQMVAGEEGAVRTAQASRGDKCS